jgi:heme/copper-type cytochrome/quinol oxidase subunit 2
MTVWIVIIGVLVLAFLTKAIVKFCRRKRNVGYHPDISTRKRLKRFVNRFKHLEGIGD